MNKLYNYKDMDKFDRNLQKNVDFEEKIGHCHNKLLYCLKYNWFYSENLFLACGCLQLFQVIFT